MNVNRAKAFVQTVEAGDITLFDILEESIAVFGYTRRGKTASCHILCQSPLRSQQQNGELIYLPSTNRFQNARVGITHQSQTWIPNIFETRVRQNNTFKPIFVLDQPGYGDTYGFHRIFSNGYFYYRTFSKTPKLKFILTMEVQDLRGTAQIFKQTIKKFMNTFNNWESVKEGVLKATALLVTKTEPKTNQETLLNMVFDLRTKMKGKQAQMFTQFVEHLVNNRKVFFIQKPNNINQVAVDANLLQRIYDKTQFWQRPLLSKNIVDLSSINFEVCNEIMSKLRNSEEQLFKEQFEQYMTYAQERIFGMILNHAGSFLNVVRLLANDAKGSIHSHKFLGAMQQFNNTYYQFIPSFENRRRTTIANLFRNIEEPNQAENERTNIYFIKKFKALEQIVKINNDIMNKNDVSVSRSIQELEQFSSKFLQMFKKMSNLGLRITDRENIVYKYCFILLRLIQESKILTLILFKNEQIKHQITQMNVKIIHEDIFRVLLDKLFLSELSSLNIYQLKREFLINLDLKEITEPNQEIILFLETVMTKPKQTKQNPNEVTKSSDIDIPQYLLVFKLARIVSLYLKSKLLSSTDKLESPQFKFLVEKLYFYRNKLYELRNEIKDAPKTEQDQCDQIIFQLTEGLAKLFLRHSMFYEAKECYRSILDADAIFQIYEIEAKSVKQDAQLYRQLLIKQAEDASFYGRKELALACYQKAFSLSYSKQQKKTMSQLIVKCGTQIKEEKDKDQYLKKMYNYDESCLSEFSQTLKASIEAEIFTV